MDSMHYIQYDVVVFSLSVLHFIYAFFTFFNSDANHLFKKKKKQPHWGHVGVLLFIKTVLSDNLQRDRRNTTYDYTVWIPEAFPEELGDLCVCVCRRVYMVCVGLHDHKFSQLSVWTTAR